MTSFVVVQEVYRLSLAGVSLFVLLKSSFRCRTEMRKRCLFIAQKRLCVKVYRQEEGPTPVVASRPFVGRGSWSMGVAHRDDCAGGYVGALLDAEIGDVLARDRHVSGDVEVTTFILGHDAE